MRISRFIIFIVISILVGGCGPTVSMRMAIVYNNVGKAKALLDEGYDINTKQKGISHLMAAMRHCDTEMVRLLLDRGANVNDKSGGSTALTEAAAFNNAEMVRLLLNRGANVNDKNHLGYTALIFAASPKSEGHKSIAFEKMEPLIDRGADVNAKDNNGSTALMFATFFDDLKCVKLLIDHGADINAKNNLGLTARIFALLRSHSLRYRASLDSLDIMSLLKDTDTRLPSNTAFLILPYPEIKLYQVVGGKDKLYENIENIKSPRGIMGRIAVFQPGEYQLKADYTSVEAIGWLGAGREVTTGEKVEFPFQAKGGCLYALKYRLQGNEWTCWIEEL